MMFVYSYIIIVSLFLISIHLSRYSLSKYASYNLYFFNKVIGNSHIAYTGNNHKSKNI